MNESQNKCKNVNVPLITVSLRRHFDFPLSGSPGPGFGYFGQLGLGCRRSKRSCNMATFVVNSSSSSASSVILSERPLVGQPPKLLTVRPPARVQVAGVGAGVGAKVGQGVVVGTSFVTGAVVGASVVIAAVVSIVV